MAVRAVASASRTPEKNRRPDIEEFLIGLGVTFTYRQGVNTKSFDAERGLRNQARLGEPLDETAVKRYTEALYAGDVFPPVLAEKVGDSLVILDGNHRLRAHTEAALPMDVYVCEAPPQTLVLITYIANTKHGLPARTEDRIHHALFLIDNGLSSADAAARLQVPVVELRRAMAKQASARRADDAGIPRPHWEAIPSSGRTRLTGIHTDEGFRGAVNLVRAAALNVTEIEKLVSDMNESRSGKRQAAIVTALRNDMAERIAEVATSGGENRKGFRRASPRARLGAAVGFVNSLPPISTYEAEPVPESLRADLADRIDSAVDRLLAIRNLL